MPRNPFRRAVHVPASVVAAAPLEKGEKVLAATATRDGSWLLGTRDALVLTGALETRIPWQHVERADWDRDEALLKVAEVGEFGRTRPEYSFAIDDPGLLLEFIRERVTASVVLQRRVSLEDGRGLFVIARRAPRGDGEITWAYQFDQGVDPADPAVMAAARRGLDTATDELGM